MQIMIEAVAEAPHLPVKLILAGMSKRGVADVMAESQRFGEVFVQTQNGRDRAGNLRNLDRMGQSIAEMVGEPGRENLRLGFQPPEGAGMHDAVAVALERIAIGMIRL